MVGLVKKEIEREKSRLWVYPTDFKELKYEIAAETIILYVSFKSASVSK